MAHQIQLQDSMVFSIQNFKILTIFNYKMSNIVFIGNIHPKFKGFRLNFIIKNIIFYLLVNKFHKASDLTLYADSPTIYSQMIF